MWYRDQDGDGYGDPSTSIEACTPPDGYVAGGDDCDDDNSDVHPDQDELCNGIDDDCDDVTDFTTTALYFAALEDAVAIPHASEFLLGASGGIEAWVLWAGTPGVASIYNKWSDTIEDHQLRADGGTIYGWVAPPGGTAYIHANSGTTTLTDTDWHHVAFVWEPGESRMYMDGILVETGTVPDAPSNASGAAYIGSIYRPPEHRLPLVGFIADVRLSSAARYVSDFVPESSLSVDPDTLALWKLDEGSGEVASEGAFGNDGTITGATWAAAPCRPAP